MIRRIVGLETEYGITSVRPEGARSLGPDEIARFLFQPVVSRLRSSNVFLENGSRLYLDVGSHPEYATAECDGLAQLIAHDRAGDRIVDDLALRAEARLRDEGFDASVYLFKNNTDSSGNSYGSHENYLLERTTKLRDLGNALLPFLVSRQLICGAGKILPAAGPHAPATAGVVDSGGEPLYCFSQRAEHMWDGVSSATTRSRPLINTRDEPHADSERFRRMHIIVGDSNMIETTTLLKVASTRLVLEMLESGIDHRDMRIAHPVRAIREISRDLTGTKPVDLADGTTASALDIQYEFLGAVRRYLDDGGGGDRDDRDLVDHAVGLWEKVLGAVESGDHDSVAADVDWAAKLSLIRRVQEKSGLDLDHPRLAQIDLTYHDIRPERGLYSLLERRGMVSRIVTDAEIEAARTTPPATTRASLRGRFVTAALEADRPFTVDWVHLKAPDTDQPTISLLDPFSIADERVNRLIEAL